MTTIGITTGCYWTLPGGAATVLQRPPPGDHDTGQTWITGVSDDGATIVGYATDADQVTKHAARWDHGVMTLLTPLTYLGQMIFPSDCSGDASVIVGDQNGGYWTGGGTTAAILPPVPGGIMAGNISFERPSTDGHVIVGNTFGAQGTRWVDGVPTSLVDNAYNYSDVFGCSADGNTVVGYGYGSPVQNTGYWRAPGLVWHPTATNQNPGNSPYMRGVNANGTVIWSDQIYNGGYTDNLDTHNASGLYGTFHHGVPPAGASFVRNSFFAVDTFSPNPVSAGFSYWGGPVWAPTDYSRSTRTTGTTTVILDMGSFTATSVTGISGDGQILSGNGFSPPNTWSPCYWDAAGTVHTTLSLPVGWTSASAVGISRDGAVILGLVSKTIDIPYVYPIPALRLIALYPQDLPDNRFSFYADSGANFPDSFGQYSLAMWCCEGVTLRWPLYPQTMPPFGLLRATPSECYAEFRDMSGTLLFSGTFVNPHPNPPVYYWLSFAIDTEVGTVVCYGDNTEWTSTDAVFASLGQIGNWMI